jgi:Restriction endonuclease
VSERIAQNLALEDDFLDETLKSGGNRFHNQVAWARQYLIWEGLLDSTERGTWKLTEKGKNTHLTPVESRQIFLKWVDINQKIRKEKSKKEIIEDQEEEEPETAEVTAENNLLSVLKIPLSLWV